MYFMAYNEKCQFAKDSNSSNLRSNEVFILTKLKNVSVVLEHNENIQLKNYMGGGGDSWNMSISEYP